jgi:hypothetical protein
VPSGALLVVISIPGHEGAAALVAGLESDAVGAFAKHRLNEALRFAVRSRPIRLRADMARPRSMSVWPEIGPRWTDRAEAYNASRRSPVPNGKIRSRFARSLTCPDAFTSII